MNKVLQVVKEHILHIPIIAALLAIVTAILALIHGAVYSQYFDLIVILGLLVGAALWVVYDFFDNIIIAWFGVLGEVCAAFGLGLYITNSYNVWADTWGNISQNGVLFGTFNFFGSEGGPVMPFIIILFGLAACVCGIVACFKGIKEAKSDEKAQ